MKRTLAIVALAVWPALAAHAVEGGLSRSITGLQVSNYAGVVPPEPGWTLAAGYVYYSGKIGAERETPIIGTSALGVDATFGLTSLTGVYVWPTHAGRWNFASMAALPYAKEDITAGLALGAARASVSDSTGNMYDFGFAPIMAGYHFDKVRHLSLALYVSAPTGHYDPNRLANTSLNVWVYSPTVAYTQLFQSGTLEWSTAVGIDLSTKNDDTDYKSGAVFHVDTLLSKSFANGWGVGGIAGWIEQVTDDSGPLADRLDGFKGHSLAIGPTVSYQQKWGDRTVAFSARWLKEFNVERRTKGEPIMLTASVTF
ncbi:transporter [Lysobacter sp. KIS68-7]|uniref:SphA family protein n=1 Tax=Lysobacter sp. KIS68-7 TaxID=2904252 RepID=UPI001E49475E|nr:transporter [Lysobacter sp. KIS68-7]UHQ19510.1 transporter [Lysobacter sp. KIS68-7]